MRKAKIDQKRLQFVALFACLQEVDYLIAMPCASSFGVAASVGGNSAYGETIVRFWKAIAALARSKSDVTRPVKYFR